MREYRPMARRIDSAHNDDRGLDLNSNKGGPIVSTSRLFRPDSWIACRIRGSRRRSEQFDRI
jgi:hypothetical protein